MVAGVKVEVRKMKRFFLRYKGELGLKTTTATVPRQRCQKCLLVFLNDHRVIHKRTEDTVVALHPESIQGIVISQKRMCNDLLASLTQENKK